MKSATLQENISRYHQLIGVIRSWKATADHVTEVFYLALVIIDNVEEGRNPEDFVSPTELHALLWWYREAVIAGLDRYAREEPQRFTYSFH